MSSQENRIKEIISTGSEMAGTATGSVLGFFMGGPVGAAAGGATGVAISKTALKVLTDVANRTLSRREEVRIGTVAAFAVEKIQLKLEAGENVRNDGFFSSPKSTERSDAEEVFEGVLLKSKNEHEERKVKFLGNVLANIAFQDGLTIGEANHVLKTVESLTYRQMISLSLFGSQLKLNNIELRDNDYSDAHVSISTNTISILQEIFQLNGLGLIDCHFRKHQNTGDFQGADIIRGESKALLGWDDIEPKLMRLTTLGEKYYNLMDLREIPRHDIETIAHALKET